MHYTLLSLPPGQNPQLAKCRGPGPSANVATEKRVTASWLILSFLDAVSEFGAASSMRLRNCPHIATEAGQYAFATSWISGSAVIDPVRAAASRACILPYSRASSGQCPGGHGCGARRQGIYQCKLARQEERGGSGMRLQPSGAVVVWKHHDVVPPQSAVPVRKKGDLLRW